MDAEVKRLLARFEAECKSPPRMVFARNPRTGDRYRFRFHQVDSDKQQRMAKGLRKRGFEVRLYGGEPEPTYQLPVWLEILKEFWGSFRRWS